MPRMILSIIVIAALAMIPTETRSAVDLGSVEGTIRVTKHGKPGVDHRDVVVYVEGVPALTGSRKAEIRQRNRQFVPRVSVVVKGTRVEFLNDDRLFHQVFSSSRPARFDFYVSPRGSDSAKIVKSVVFKREGVVDVFCNIHPAMSSRVLVVPNPLFATTDASGRFRIDGIPAGMYRLKAWHPDGDPVVLGPITIERARATSVTFDVAEGQLPTRHVGKAGVPWR